MGNGEQRSSVGQHADAHTSTPAPSLGEGRCLGCRAGTSPWVLGGVPPAAVGPLHLRTSTTGWSYLVQPLR